MNELFIWRAFFFSSSKCVCVSFIFFFIFFLYFTFQRERERNITKRPVDPGAREGRTPTGAASAAYLPNDRALASQITQDEKNSVPQTAASSTNRKKKSERTKQKKKWIRFFLCGKKSRMSHLTWKKKNSEFKLAFFLSLSREKKEEKRHHFLMETTSLWWWWWRLA